MTISLITEGLLGGGSTDSNPPVLTALTPTPNTAPGAVGGMPADYTTASITPIVISVTDSDGPTDLTFIGVSFVFLDGTTEVAYRASNFVGEYVLHSYAVSITNGRALHFQRTAGWPGATLAGNLAVGLQVDAVDKGGNLTSNTFYYEMPLEVAIVATPTPPVVTAGAVDIVTHGLGRLIWQLRSA